MKPLSSIYRYENYKKPIRHNIKLHLLAMGDYLGHFRKILKCKKKRFFQQVISFQNVSLSGFRAQKLAKRKTLNPRRKNPFLKTMG